MSSQGPSTLAERLDALEDMIERANRMVADAPPRPRGARTRADDPKPEAAADARREAA